MLKLFQLQHTPKVVKTKEGYLFEVTTASDYLLIMDMMEDIYGKIERDSIVVDIGAHKGVFTIRAATFAKEVHCFEPSEENFNTLDRNLDLNEINNVMGNMMAVTGKGGSVDLLLSKSALTNSIYHGLGKETGQVQKVMAITLNDIAKELPKIDFLKIDVEGAEYDILYNTSQETFDKINRMVIELHPHSSYNNTGLVYNEADLINFLKQKGFYINDTKIGGYTHLFGKRKDEKN